MNENNKEIDRLKKELNEHSSKCLWFNKDTVTFLKYLDERLSKIEKQIGMTFDTTTIIQRIENNEIAIDHIERQMEVK